MALFTDQVREQLRARFTERLTGQVALRLFVRPGSGRLILPSGMGCATCEEARELATELADAAPADKLSLEVIDVTESAAPGIEEVPTLQLGLPGEEPRISFRGLPAGFEFAAVVDAIERLSGADHGLAPESLEALQRVTEPIEVMVFATPT